MWQRLDCFVSFRVPSWACVERWRALQEQKLADALAADPGRPGRAMTPDELARFLGTCASDTLGHCEE